MCFIGPRSVYPTPGPQVKCLSMIVERAETRLKKQSRQNGSSIARLRVAQTHRKSFSNEKKYVERGNLSLILIGTHSEIANSTGSHAPPGHRLCPFFRIRPRPGGACERVRDEGMLFSDQLPVFPWETDRGEDREEHVNRPYLRFQNV